MRLHSSRTLAAGILTLLLGVLAACVDTAPTGVVPRVPQPHPRSDLVAGVPPSLLGMMSYGGFDNDVQAQSTCVTDGISTMHVRASGTTSDNYPRTNPYPGTFEVRSTVTVDAQHTLTQWNGFDAVPFGATRTTNDTIVIHSGETTISIIAEGSNTADADNWNLGRCNPHVDQTGVAYICASAGYAGPGSALLYQAQENNTRFVATITTPSGVYRQTGVANTSFVRNWVSCDGSGGRGTSSSLFGFQPWQETSPVVPNNSAPVAAIVGGPFTVEEGTALQLGNGSTDPDNDALTYAWTFGDGGADQSASPTHTYADQGAYVVTLGATDPSQTTARTSATVTVTNALPVVFAGAGATLTSGQSFTPTASFTDAGAGDAPWAYTIAWGDGSTAATGTVSTQGPLPGTPHRYVVPGTYQVQVRVTDKDGGPGTAATAVTVRALEAKIDIQPGQTPNAISLKKLPSTVPVAILGSQTIDVTQIDPTTLTLGNEQGIDTPVARSSTGTLLVNPPLDVNADGRPDLVVYFSTTDLSRNGDIVLTAGTSYTLALRGATKAPDGRVVRGTDALTVNP